jgi:hypothetical protein
MTNHSKYDRAFFDGLADVGLPAARLLLRDIRALHPFDSVCDIGCGSGNWLRAAAEIMPAENRRLTGVDGDYARDIAKCDGAKFVFQDLERRVTGIDRHDLALSLEVAEHLSAARAESFVADLCAISDVVFFSGAVDGQRGTNHLNERPQSYWAGLFREHGYDPHIFHRTKYWNDPVFELCPYYVSGSFLYVSKNIPLHDRIADLRAQSGDVIDVVHPNILKWQKEESIPLPDHARRFVRATIRAIRQRI